MTTDELQQYKKHLELLAEVRRLEEFTGFAAGQNGRRVRADLEIEDLVPLGELRFLAARPRRSPRRRRD